MADEKETQGESTEGLESKVETVSIEQFQELQRQFAETKKAQSGSDKTVTELKKLLLEREKEADEASKTSEEKFAERIKALEVDKEQAIAEKLKADQRSLAIQLLNDKGIKAPGYLNRLLGKDAEETEALITEYMEERLSVELSVADKFAKDNGRKVNKGKTDVKTLDDYSDEEIDSMSQAEFLKVQERSK